jgi:hypothetical protein
MRTGNWIVLSGVLVLISVQPSLAQWAPGGIPVGSTGDIELQDESRVVADGQGGMYVSWRDERTNTTTGLDIYLQHVLSDGRLDPRWPTSGLPVFASPGDEQDSQLAADGTGGVLVVDDDARNGGNAGLDLYAQRILANGQVAPGWPPDGVSVCSAAGNQQIRTLCPDGNGGAYLAWDDFRNGARHARMSRIAGNGTIPSGWSGDGLPLSGLGNTTGSPMLVPEPDGCLAVWTDTRGGTAVGFSMFALRLTDAGAVYPGWPVDGVALQSSGTVQAVQHAASDGLGGAFVAWDDNRSGTPTSSVFYYDLYAQHILGNGALDSRWGANGIPVCTAPDAQYDFGMAEDGFGGALIAWEDGRDPYYQIYGLRLNADGTRAPGWALNGNPLSASPITKFIPKVTYDQAGGLYGFWTQYNSVGPTRVYAQHMNGDGSVAVEWDPTGIDLSMPLDGQSSSNEAICADGFGGALVSFEKDDSFGVQIFAARVMADGPVPTLLSFADYDAGSGRVTLRWQASNAADIRATVERSPDGTAWTPLGATRLEGTDLLVYDDLGVSAGRWSYRLSYLENGVQRFSDAVLVQVSTAAELALGGFRPNPATSNSAIAFSLPDARPARLEVLDVRGRILLTREVGGLGAGTHNVRLSEAGRLGAGVYWVRLVRPETTLTRKGVVVG